VILKYKKKHRAKALCFFLYCLFAKLYRQKTKEVIKMSTKVGILQNNKPLTPEQVTQLENQILTNGNFAFYTKPEGELILLTGCWPISNEIEDMAWHKLVLLSTHGIKEIKEVYARDLKDKWSFEIAYYRNLGETAWRPIISKNTALLKEALLGKMNLGRRY
jgi:hypothetical protein